MKITLLKNIILVLLFCIGGLQSSYATHIIGGEMNYRCLGNNEYEVLLTVYRDCFLGEALLDDTAYVAIFDESNTLVQTLPILLGQIDTIIQIDECFLAPPNICVETTTYVDTVTLLPQSGGYHLAYQRCCRNSTILNIVDPLNTGATYDIVLTEDAMISCNSSPKLNDWPPTFVCVNKQLVYDSGASDEDGDSLVYSLCTPFRGGIPIDNPRPRPSFPPPFEHIIWNSPTYDLNNLLGGAPLTIDRNTGLLVGTPNLIGQFVVGVCVEEYRHGQLLSTTRRDFQYNVIPCEEVVAKFDLEESQCENLLIHPTNLTEGEPEGFLWKFLDEELNLIGSTDEKKPNYTFPDTGKYIVRLIVNPNSICSDSTDRHLFLQNNSLIPDFQYDILGCVDSLELQFVDNSINTLGEVEGWFWSFNGEFDQLTSKDPNPKITLKTSQKLEVTLVVSTNNGCIAQKQIELDAKIIPDSFSVSAFDSLFVCKGDSIELNPVFNSDLVYLWSPSDGLSDANAPNPLAFPSTSTAYQVIIKDSSENCELRKNVFLEVIDFDTLFDFTIHILECGDSTRLQINPDEDFVLGDRTLSWTIENMGEEYFFSNLNPIVVIKNESPVNVIGIVSDKFGCSKTLRKSIQVDLMGERIAPLFTLCKGDSIELNSNFNSAFEYSWSPANLFLDATLPNPIIGPQINSEISVIISNPANGCSINRSTFLEVNPGIEVLDFEFVITSCTDSLNLEITKILSEPENVINEVFWNLSGDLVNKASTEMLPTFDLGSSQSIELSLTVNPKGLCPKTIIKSFEVTLMENMELPDSVIICLGESIALNPNNNLLPYKYNWTPAATLDNATSAYPIASPNATTEYQLTYSDSSQFCQLNKQTKVVVLDTLPPLLVDYSIACDGRTVTFTPNAFTEYNVDFGDGSTSFFQYSEFFILQKEYAEAGIYPIKFRFANPQLCVDSFEFLITIPEKNLVLDFDWKVTACENNIATLEFTDKTSIEVGEIDSWKWTFSNGQSSFEQSPSFDIQSPNPISATLVIEIAGLENCIDSVSKNIPALVVDEMIPDSIISCAGSAINLNPDFNENYNYLWTPTTGISDPTQPNPNIQVGSPQTYTVEISNEFNCKIIDSIFTNTAPFIEINTLDIPVVCDTMELVLLAESEQIIDQIWLNEQGDTLGSEPELLITISEPQLFTALFTDGYGCQNKESVFVDFQPIRLDYPKTQPVCLNEPKTLIISNLNSGSALNFEWTPSHEVISGGTSNMPEVAPLAPTTFSFTVENESGCQSDGAIFVDIFALPEILATAEPDTIFEGETAELMATNNPNYSYDWSPSNSLDEAGIFDPSATPLATTNYEVRVTDENACTNTAAVQVVVKEGFCEFPYIFVPSGFTPNGDGKNDVLFVRGTFIENLNFVIYDRWGDKVFETSNQAVGWDGKRNGKELPSGVFGYYLTVVCKNQDTYSKQGNVTLIR